jgi:hypothetical protein
VVALLTVQIKTKHGARKIRPTRRAVRINKMQIVEIKATLRIPVTVVSYAEVGSRLRNARHGADSGENLAIKLTQGEAVVERVVDENRRFQHHEEVSDCQVYHEHVGRRAKRLCPGIKIRKQNTLKL